MRCVSLISNCVTTHSFDTSQRLDRCPDHRQRRGDRKGHGDGQNRTSPRLVGTCCFWSTRPGAVPSIARWIHLT